MQLIVGLGNPGEKYSQNRHNAGFLFVDAVASKNKIGWENKSNLNAEIAKSEKLFLVKPTTFMNSSGLAVRKILDYFNISLNLLYVVHDDLDIKLGEYKLQKAVGPKLHNGINSIENALGTDQFWRIRIGVDNRNPEKRLPGDVYSLQDFTKNEMEKIYETNKKIMKELL